MTKEKAAKEAHNASFLRENLHLYSFKGKGFLHSSISDFPV